MFQRQVVRAHVLSLLVVYAFASPAPASAQCTFPPNTEGYHASRTFEVTIVGTNPGFVFGAFFDHSLFEQVVGCYENSTPGGSLLLADGITTRTNTLTNCPEGAAAVASSRWNMTTDAAGAHGSLCLFGSTIVDPLAGGLFASSTGTIGLQMETGRTTTRGHIRWGISGRWRMVAASPAPQEHFDTIDYTVSNSSTNDVLAEGNVLGMSLALLESTPNANSAYVCANVAGECSNQLVFDARNFDFTITMNAAVVTTAAQRGNLTLSVRNGRVTASQDDGIFNNFLPALNAQTPIVLNRTIAFDFDYNFGSFGSASTDVLLDILTRAVTEEQRGEPPPVRATHGWPLSLLGLGLAIGGLLALRARRKQAAG
jgi:hypothetical protein